jgi:hypothetical protein
VRPKRGKDLIDCKTPLDFIGENAEEDAMIRTFQVLLFTNITEDELGHAWALCYEHFCNLSDSKKSEHESDAGVDRVIRQVQESCGIDPDELDVLVLNRLLKTAIKKSRTDSTFRKMIKEVLCD